jgi:predicted metal-binding membrane protein
VALVVVHASPAQTHGSHASHLAGGTAAATATATPAFAAALGGWALMSVAMMTPATLPAIRHVGLNTIRRRRRWAMTVYLAAYLAVWVGLGVLALAVERAARATGSSSRSLVVATLVVATGWQLTRWKRRALGACRRTVPLPPEGWRADTACASFGGRQAARCVVTCWPLMLLAAVVGHGGVVALVTMGALTVAIVAEERAAVSGRLVRPIAVALAVATVGVASLR